MMPGDVELFATYWTLAGDVIPALTSEVSPFDFRTRVEAARKAGFRGLGLSLADYRALSEQVGVKAMKQILADNDLPCVEFEVLSDWFADGERRARSDAARRDLLRAAEQFGARQIKIIGDVVDTSDDAWPLEHLADEFRALCAEAAGVGTRVALELLPFANLKNLKQGLELVRIAGAANGGLLIDIWHMERGNIDFAEISALPKEVIFWVELDDADAESKGTMYEDTVHNRRLCGEGSFDIPGFLRAIRDTGYDGGYGVEIISREHRRRPLDEAAALAFTTTIKQFERAAS